MLCKNIVDVMGGSKSQTPAWTGAGGWEGSAPALWPGHSQAQGGGRQQKAFPFTPASKASPAVPEGSKGLITAPPPSPLPFPRSWGLLPVPQL